MQPSKQAASRQSRAKSREAFRDSPSARAELPGAWIDFATVFDFHDYQFKSDEEIRKSETGEREIIGMNGIEGDIAFATDLRIRAAWEFEMDRERYWVLHK